MDVLVTDGMMKKSLAVVRTIDPLTAKTGVISSYPTSVAGVSQYADEHHRVARSTPKRYVSRLNRIFERETYDYLLPIGGWTTRALTEQVGVLDPAVGVVLPGSEAMATAQSKLETARLAERLGVPTPRTAMVTPDTDPERILETYGTPVVVKAPTESARRFVEYADSSRKLRAAVETYRRRDGDDPLVQEYLPGEGCGFFALYLDGRLAGHYSHTRIREYPPTGGISACAESNRDPRLRELGTRLLDDLGWNGPVMVEFKRDAGGTPNLVEINPKLWGSLDLAIASGLDFPSALLRYMDSGERPEFTYRERRCHWPLSGDLQHAVSRPGSAGAVLADIVSSDTASNLSLLDPLPNVYEAGKAVLSPFID